MAKSLTHIQNSKHNLYIVHSTDWHADHSLTLPKSNRWKIVQVIGQWVTFWYYKKSKPKLKKKAFKK
jgi:hypothetical protein